MLRRPVAAALLIGAVLTPVTLPAVTGAARACAAATGPHAALVIETGSRDLRLCVTLDASSVSGTHLIELAAAQQGLSYGFGSGGQAVCQLAGVGPQGDDCFANYPDFWGYWRGDGRGGWTWSSTGAAATRVGDGGLNGWVWGSGDSGSTHGRPPALASSDVCATPTPAPATAAAAAPLPASSPRATADSTSPTARSNAVPSPTAARLPDPTIEPPSSRSIAVAAAVQGEPPADSAPGPGLLLALAVGIALALGGWLRLRGARRRGGADNR